MSRFPYFLKQAHARYPREPLTLALMMFESDRRMAGLGALDITKRLHRKNEGYKFVSNTKQMHVLNGTCVYQLAVHRLAFFEYPEFDSLMPTEGSGAECVTVTRKPEKFSERWVPVNPRDLWTERGRDMIAYTLRKVRREMRKDLNQ